MLPIPLPSVWPARTPGSSEHQPRSTALGGHERCAGLKAQAGAQLQLVLGTLVLLKGQAQLLIAKGRMCLLQARTELTKNQVLGAPG